MGSAPGPGAHHGRGRPGPSAGRRRLRPSRARSPYRRPFRSAVPQVFNLPSGRDNGPLCLPLLRTPRGTEHQSGGHSNAFPIATLLRVTDPRSDPLRPGAKSAVYSWADRRRAFGDSPKGSILCWPERPGDSSPGPRPPGAAPGWDRRRGFAPWRGARARTASSARTSRQAIEPQANSQGRSINRGSFHCLPGGHVAAGHRPALRPPRRLHAPLSQRVRPSAAT